MSSVMRDRYVKSDANRRIFFVDAIILYGQSMIQPLPYDEFEIKHGHPDLYLSNSEEDLNTPDDSNIGYFVEVDLRYIDIIKEKTKTFPFCPENKVIPKDKNNEFMKKRKPKSYIKARRLLCDWTD